ncbi:MAG TPA: hypothetical protein VGP93_19410, partial [Polyangiaceae bacterium]|nr:hypothetical protein [Polyangiaceae bacterium]
MTLQRACGVTALLVLCVGCGASSPDARGNVSGSSGSGGSGGNSGSGGSSSSSGGSGVPAGGSGAGAANAGSGGGAGSIATGGAASGSPELGPRDSYAGPGGPAKSFENSELYVNCAFLDGGASDQNHHNGVAMVDGYLVLPWAHEAGGGGISFYDVSDPCAPLRVGEGISSEIRETHTLAISNIGGRHMFTAFRSASVNEGGIQIWDIEDVTQPTVAATFSIPGHVYPNAYDFVVMSVFVQGHYAYLAAGYLGIFVLDIADPLKPEIVGSYKPEPNMRVMEALAIGNTLFTHASESSRVVLLDISDPVTPQPIPGGDFALANESAATTNAYSGNFNGGYGWFARQSNTSGLIVYDLRDP